MLNEEELQKYQDVFERLKKIKHLKVETIMREKVITLDVNDLLATTARTIIENRIHGVIIMNGDKVYSILDSWDLLHVSYQESFSDKMDYLRTPIKDIIERPRYISLSPNDTLADAAKIIAKSHVRTVPIIENDRLVGVIAISDLVETYYKLMLENE